MLSILMENDTQLRSLRIQLLTSSHVMGVLMPEGQSFMMNEASSCLQVLDAKAEGTAGQQDIPESSVSGCLTCSSDTL